MGQGLSKIATGKAFEGDGGMKMLGTEVQFKSNPNAYWFEKEGIKNHTERLLTAVEEKWLMETKVEQIRISNICHPSAEFFVREITNIYKEGQILGYSLYSFTWKHEIDEVQK